MKKLALLLLSPLLLSALSVSSQATEVQSFCNLAAPDKVRVFNWVSWRGANISDPNLYYEPFRWDASRDLWRGYDADQPFEQPRNAYKHWSVTLTQADGTEQRILILESRSTPETDYIYVFDNVQPSAENTGDHFGYHPCRAFAADSAVIADWLHRVYNS